ncbi:hypothetical protein BGZ73_008102, partial [Actinomortierella ambigua]
MKLSAIFAAIVAVSATVMASPIDEFRAIQVGDVSACAKIGDSLSFVPLSNCAETYGTQAVPNIDCGRWCCGCRSG